MLAPAPPVFTGSLQSVPQSGPPPPCAGANVMQTNTSFVVGHFSLRPAGAGEKEGKGEKGERGERDEEGEGRSNSLA